MLGFVQTWFKPGANPIGVDFGSDSLRLAQVERIDGEYRLVAAASADVPPHIRHDPSARLNFFAETTRELLVQGNFRGRRPGGSFVHRRAAGGRCGRSRAPTYEYRTLW